MKKAAKTGTGKYEQLLERCKGQDPVPTAVAHPCEETALSGALEAAELGLIRPILVGPVAKIEQIAREIGADLDGVELVDAPHSHASAAVAVELVRNGKAELLMKGSLHSDELLGAVIARDTGLRTGRRVSHVFIMDVPTYHKVLVVTDAAINIAPDLEAKADIVRNAIDLAIAIGIDSPKVAILAAVETVNPKMIATIDAAACARWPTAGRLPAACWTARWRSTMPSARKRRRQRALCRRSPATPTFCSYPISRPATCSRSSSVSSPMPTARDSCSVRGCRSS
jgi:phosphotransacetylase